MEEGTAEFEMEEVRQLTVAVVIVHREADHGTAISPPKLQYLHQRQMVDR